MKLPIEDSPPYHPSRWYWWKRFMLATRISLRLFAIGCLLIVASGVYLYLMNWAIEAWDGLVR